MFAVQLLLNAAWSPLFFTLGLRGIALVDILLLVAALSVTIVLFSRVSCRAAAVLVPYWAWVVFATVLNFSIWQLNIGG